ncbi:hypothetical protein PPE_06595 [Paenibacillus polymyxa E681]|nr:hypothetical protein PPE_06595 [Paenibacillus polymyxa E681]
MDCQEIKESFQNREIFMYKILGIYLARLKRMQAAQKLW